MIGHVRFIRSSAQIGVDLAQYAVADADGGTRSRRQSGDNRNWRNVTDEPLSFGRSDQSLTEVEVVLADRTNIVSGRVTDNRARSVPGVTVVVFGAGRAQWYPASRFIQTAVTTDDGTYSLAGLPTDTYFVAVVAQPPAGDGWWQDPAILDSIRPSATTITLGDDQVQAVNLRVR
jgi:hypothetical protein